MFKQFSHDAKANQRYCFAYNTFALHNFLTDIKISYQLLDFYCYYNFKFFPGDKNV